MHMPNDQQQQQQGIHPENSATGIWGLDDILCGGFTPYRLYLIEGVPGSGKTTLALLAVLASWITGNVVYDALGSIAIGVLLIVVAVLVAIEVKALLVGQGVEPAVREEMVAFLRQQPHVREVLNVLTLHMGADVMVAIKARMADCPTSDDLARAINDIEARFRERFPQVAWTFFEPDIR